LKVQAAPLKGHFLAISGRVSKLRAKTVSVRTTRAPHAIANPGQLNLALVFPDDPWKPFLFHSQLLFCTQIQARFKLSATKSI
jgi:hypothetical protein